MGTPNKMYRFVASTVGEKDSWYSEIHRLILAQKRLFSKVSFRHAYLLMYSSSSFLFCLSLSLSLLSFLLLLLSLIVSLQLIVHLSVPDEVYYCAHVKSKISYLGMLKDGQSVSQCDT